MKLKDLKKLNVEATARALEADAGEPLPEIRQALAEVKAGTRAFPATWRSYQAVCVVDRASGVFR